MQSLIAPAVFAFLLSFGLTPLVRNLCLRWGLVDHPDERKVHLHPIPRAGGVAIALAYVLAYVFATAIGSESGHIVLSARGEISKVLIPAGIVFLVGIVDDIYRLTAFPKFTVQTIAAVCAYFSGVQLASVGGHPLPAWVSLPATILWLLACTNALNLIDGLDGLATGIGVFATGATLAAALVQHNIGLALAVAPLFGALLAFLYYNFSPASIFLGDSGSLFIGFLLGCYGILWSHKSSTLLGMTAPLMALAIPLLDTSLSIARRFLRSKPIFSADRGHIHHRLLDHGLTTRKAVLILYACCAVGALCSIAVMNPQTAEVVALLFFAVVIVGIQHLRYVEFGLLLRLFRPQHLRSVLQARIHMKTLEDQLDRAQTPDECWAAVRGASADLGFHHLTMRLVNRSYEENIGNEDRAPHDTWTLRVPLSETEFINVGQDFANPFSPLIAVPLAHALRRALKSKFSDFDINFEDDVPPSALSMHGQDRGDEIASKRG